MAKYQNYECYYCGHLFRIREPLFRCPVCGHEERRQLSETLVNLVERVEELERSKEQKSKPKRGEIKPLIEEGE